MNVFDRLGKQYYPGSSISGKAYQDISFLGYDVPSHRKGTVERANHINSNFEVKGKMGLDMGCSVGALSMALAKLHGANMWGVDIDHQSIDVAKYIARENDIENADFSCTDVTSETFRKQVEGFNIDFCIWYSNFMWIAKGYGWDVAFNLLSLISENIPVLFFETSQGPNDGVAASHHLAGPEGVAKALKEHTSYDSIRDLGIPPGQKWAKRHVFLAVKDA